jgi:histidine triad (HIT) family protein
MADHDCLFCRIVAGKIPADKVRETEDILVFRDIAPQAPVHLLAVPKRHLSSIADVTEADGGMLGSLFVAANAAATAELGDRGYRLVTNVGEEAGQSVFHLHLHILGGAPLGPLAVTSQEGV